MQYGLDSRNEHISLPSSIQLFLSFELHVFVCFIVFFLLRALTGLSLIMRAGSVNLSELTDPVFAPVFSTGGGVAGFCKKTNKQKKSDKTSIVSTKQYGKSALILFVYVYLRSCYNNQV